MKDRRDSILQAIVQSFIQTANPVGSRFLQESFQFSCSPATIRNDMGQLEEEGYLSSPHTSSGRIPTQKGFRFFVAQGRDDFAKIRPSVQQDFTKKLHHYLEQKKHDERAFDAVSVLTELTPNVAFASVPSTDRMFFLGFSNVLQQPEFLESPQMASGVFRVLEHDFETVLRGLNIQKEAQIFIGNENVLPEIQSCSLIVSRFSLKKSEGFVGILGPMRMEYGKNIAAVEVVRDFLEDHG